MLQNMTVMARAQSWFEMGINVNGKTDLYAIENGTLTALRYCTAILDQFVRSYAGLF